MSELIYFLEQLKPIPALEWNEENCDTLAWSRVPDLEFGSVMIARAYVETNLDNRLSYRVTDGGRVWPI